MELSEQDRQRIEKEARAYAILLVDEDDVDGTPQLVCYVDGARHERLLAESEKEELRKEVERLKADSDYNHKEYLRLRNLKESALRAIADEMAEVMKPVHTFAKEVLSNPQFGEVVYKYNHVGITLTDLRAIGNILTRYENTKKK